MWRPCEVVAPETRTREMSFNRVTFESSPRGTRLAVHGEIMYFAAASEPPLNWLLRASNTDEAFQRRYESERRRPR